MLKRHREKGGSYGEFAGTTFAFGGLEGFLLSSRRLDVSGKSDEIKGRVKEAAGAIADNNKLRREGKIDQAAGKTKQAVEKVVDRVKKAVNEK